jgi:PHD/YefM family antitoxin component YafN of YafNO toxin-antitoxin module
MANEVRPVALRVRLDEIMATKEAARTLPSALDRLESGTADQFVITRRNVPRAVLITVERYEQLIAAEAQRAGAQARAA